MKIFKFNESVNSGEIFKDMFMEAEEHLEYIKDLFIEVEDTESFTIGYNYCVYYPSTKKFAYSDTLVESFRSVSDEFTKEVIDDILQGNCNFSYLVGIAIGDFESYDYESVQGEDVEGSDNTFADYSQLNLISLVKMSQIVKQVDLRLNRSKYNVKYQIDNDGISILIGRISV